MVCNVKQTAVSLRSSLDELPVAVHDRKWTPWRLKQSLTNRLESWYTCDGPDMDLQNEEEQDQQEGKPTTVSADMMTPEMNELLAMSNLGNRYRNKYYSHLSQKM